MLDIERLAFGHELHALTEAARLLGLVGQEVVQRELGVVAEAVGGLVRLARARVPHQRFGQFHERRRHFERVHAHVVAEVGIFRHHAAEGGVTDLAGGGFEADAVGHGVGQEPMDDRFG